MKTYTSIENIPVYNFFKMLKDVRYVCKSEKLPRYKKKYKEIADKIIEEFEDKTGGGKEYREKQAYLIKLKRQLLIMNNCLYILSSRNDEETIKMLKEVGHNFTTLKRLSSEIKMLKNKIILKQKEEIQEEIDMYKIISIIERDRGFKIDPKKLTVAEYIIYINELCQKQ